MPGSPPSAPSSSSRPRARRRSCDAAPARLGTVRGSLPGCLAEVRGGTAAWIRACRRPTPPVGPDAIRAAPRPGTIGPGCGPYRVGVLDAGAPVPRCTWAHRAMVAGTFGSDSGCISRGRSFREVRRAGPAHGGADMRSTSRRGGFALAAITILGALGSAAWPTTNVAAAGPDPILDVELDVDTVQIGATVTLTARIFDTDGTTPAHGSRLQHAGPVPVPRRQRERPRVRRQRGPRVPYRPGGHVLGELYRRGRRN